MKSRFHQSPPKTVKDRDGRPVPRRDKVLASAALVTRTQIKRATNSQARQGWQDEAWGFYDRIGELRVAGWWMSNACGKARLIVGEYPDDMGEPVPVDDPPEAVTQVLEQLHQGKAGQSEMLRRMALHLTIVGETYLIGLEPETDDETQPTVGDMRWLVASTDEFSSSGNRPRVTLPETGEKRVLDPDKATIIRLWIPHGREAWRPESTVQANIATMREIDKLSQHIAATVDSRLAGAGVLAIPHGAVMPQPQQSATDGTDGTHQSAFVTGLTDAMITAIENRDDASAVVPIVITVPDEAIGKIQHLTFATELDDKVVTMRQDAIRRLAGSMDMPGEVILGMSGNASGGGASNAGASHWSAWQISESAVSMHVEPLLSVICSALTQQYFHPALRAANVPNPERYVVWVDTSELRQRPDRSTEAQALYDRGQLSPEALLRENGFSEHDLPDDDQQVRILARSLLLAKPDLAITTNLGQLLGLPQMQPGQQARSVPSTRTDNDTGQTGQRGEQSSPEIGSSRNNPPQQATASAESGAPVDAQLVAITESATLRALELAGKRLFSHHPRRDKDGAAAQLHPWELHTVVPAPDSNSNMDKLLNGAWEPVRAMLGTSPCVETALDTYWRTLLASGTPHRRETLVTMLRESGCIPRESVDA